MGEKVRNNLNYIIIGVVSLIMLGFIPLIGSQVGLEWKVPTTTAGWIVWSISKLSTAIFNILILHCFIQQGKLNVRDDPMYVKANEILHNADKGLFKKPRSPKEYFKQVYGKKGTMLFFSTCIGLVGFSQALITFELTEFISQLIVVIMGVIFGLLQMKSTEAFWTTEYYEYAKIETSKEKENV